MFLNILGLSFNIIGAILIWKYGLPAKIDREGHRHLLLEGEDGNQKRLAKKYDRLSNFGMLLLILGFVSQLIALL